MGLVPVAVTPMVAIAGGGSLLAVSAARALVTVGADMRLGGLAVIAILLRSHR